MQYLDTSVLVALLCREPKSAEVVTWFYGLDAGGVAISQWSLVEFAGALSLKIRMRSIADSDAHMAKAMLNDMLEGMLQVLPLVGKDFDDAAGFCADWDLNLRGPDALHLAITARLGICLATFDRHQFAAAQHFGIAATIP
ncbi:MAG: type II toxin-antitoxin system VapC family toxin [Blastomonas sp.]